MLRRSTNALRLLRVWTGVAGLSLGVVWGFGHRASVLDVAVSLLGAAALGFRRKPVLLIVGILLATFGAGAVDASLRSQRTSAASVLASDFARCDISGTVIESQGALGTLVAIERATCPGLASLQAIGTVMFPDQFSDPGAPISATGTFVPLRDDSFDVARRRAGASALFDVERASAGTVTSPALRLAASIRRGLQRATRQLRPPREGLVRGLAIGDTSKLDAVMVEDFRRAGLSHLLAVSGENLAMFLAALALVVRRLPYKLRLLAYLAATCLFVLVVGPQPSVLRAAVMGAVMVAAVGRGHRAQPLGVLATSLMLVIAFRPGLVFSVGLQLSAAATAGIVLWTKPVERFLRRLPRTIALPLAVTISAQVAVSPILIGTFGQLSVVSPLANLLAFPAVAPPTVLGLCAGALSLFSARAARSVASLAGPFAGWIAWVGRTLGEAPGAAIDLPHAVGWVVSLPILMMVVAAAIQSTE